MTTDDDPSPRPSATGSPPSGSRTPPPGWPGPITATTGPASRPIPWVYAEIVRHLSPPPNTSASWSMMPRPEKRADQGAGQATTASTLTRKCGSGTSRPTGSGCATSAPTFVVNSARLEAGPRSTGSFNAWAKYDNYRSVDDKVRGHRSIEHVDGPPPPGSPRAGSTAGPTRVVLEGGSIDVNGRGTVLTTEECLLSDVQARNPRPRCPGRERALRRLPRPRPIRRLARPGDRRRRHPRPRRRPRPLRRPRAPSSIAPRTRPVRRQLRPDLKDNLERLKGMPDDQDGALWTSSPLPMPGRCTSKGQRLPASYANFYVANGLVLVPDLQRPGRPRGPGRRSRPPPSPGAEVVGIHAVDLVWGLGTLHCMTRDSRRRSGVEDVGDLADGHGLIVLIARQ